MTIIVDGLSVFYKKTGSGPAVLLLHGWGDTHATFEALSSKLADKFTVITLDLPGFGQTEAPEGDYDLKKYATFTSAFLDKINVNSLHGLVGHSNGGAIALKAVAAKIISPKKLVLLASSGIRNPYSPTSKALRLAAKTAKLPVMLLPKRLQTKLKKKAYKVIGSELFVAENLQGTFKNIVNEDLSHQVESIDIPALLVYGEQDSSTPVAYGKTFVDKMKQARLLALPGGHFIHHDASEKVAQEVMEFLL